ncbi:FprA family A-type flavoprotein [Thermospira aquatica]|uniref:FprA family A-type flavoprotein n=1 Tax=Thermospira aquatica TaxID=2828656 RepID=A0AAX3BDQ8_9SPIR|nr:FprA family A-type flavoprotein [Thermospira aquatica]URA10437.1 FprA family A-type flavoprotein [Thermospira aquatica]
MSLRKITEGIYAVGGIDWHRTSFDELTPLHEGTTYNCYYIEGSEKNVLIDTIEPKMLHVLLGNLSRLGVKKLDYVVSNHAEQDHSGSLPKILEIYPEAKLVTNAKAKPMLQDLLLLPDERFLVIEDRTTLSLGNRTLEFILFPWVHWPETMFTFLREERILFSGDLFGSHYASSYLFSSQHDVDMYEGSKRYFAEIMYPFRQNIASGFEKILSLNARMIAPTHGPVYDNPDVILSLYREWISDKMKNKVLLPFISMHGSTEVMINYLIDRLIDRGIEAIPFHLSHVDVGQLAMELIDAPTIVVGVSAVLGGMHPAMAYILYFLNLMRPAIKHVGIVASYGWGSRMLEHIQGSITNYKPEILTPVMVKGFPKPNDFAALDTLADTIAEKHRALSL